MLFDPVDSGSHPFLHRVRAWPGNRSSGGKVVNHLSAQIAQAKRGQWWIFPAKFLKSVPGSGESTQNGSRHISNRWRFEGFPNGFRHVPDLDGLIVRNIKHAAMYPLRWDKKKLLDLVNYIPHVSIGLKEPLSSRMYIQAFAHNIEEPSIGHSKPRTPYGCRPNQDPRYLQAAGAHDLLALGFTGAVKCERSVLGIATRLVCGGVYVSRGGKDRTLHASDATNRRDDVAHAGGVGGIVRERGAIEITTTRKVNNQLRLE